MKRVRRFLLFLFSLTLFLMPLCVCVCVVRVHADTATYSLYEANTCVKVHQYQTQYKTYEFNNDGRMVIINSNGTYFLNFVFDTFTQYREAYGNYNVSCPAGTFGNTALVDGYYMQNAILAEDYLSNFSDTPIFSVMNDNVNTTAIYYTYGHGAVDPVEPVNWGLVDLIGYQTNVAGSGNAAINNVDVISWNDTFDTLSNDISEGNVRIRYVPGHYKAVDKPNLLQQLYTDFILDVVIDDAEGLYPVTDGSASFRWGQVIEDLSIPFYSIYNLSNSAEGWIKRGWIYQVRLEIDDYIGEWQTVYASTSSGVENDLEIVNTTTITQNTINAIQQVNTINDTTNIWIIYETPVDPSPEYQPPEDDDEKPWWVYLLEMINNSIGVTNEYISEGTDESVQVVNNINNDNDTLNQTVNEYDDIEDDLITDFNDNTENIDLDDTLIGNNGFLNAARWISEQFTTITTDNPFGAILKFSLVLGFVLIFLGRFR